MVPAAPLSSYIHSAAARHPFRASKTRSVLPPRRLLEGGRL